MKLYKLAIAAALAGVLAFSSCDNIDENDRYTPIEKPTDSSRTLLIQEFTGNRCVNCPEGAAALHSIQDSYPGQVIVVGLHPYGANGKNPNTAPLKKQDLRSNAAQAIFDIYAPDGFPYLVLNGKGSDALPSMWFTIATDSIINMANQPVNVTIRPESKYDPTSRELKVNFSLDFLNNVTCKDGLGTMVWVMENNIVGYQLNAQGETLDDYVHNHVLRAALEQEPGVNGDNGKIIGTSFNEGDTYSGSASIKLDEKWVAENCQVVIYVFDSGNHWVEQASLLNVIPAAK